MLGLQSRTPSSRRRSGDTADTYGNVGSGYSYDIENRLLKAGTGMPQYAYDAGNKRIARDAEFTFWAGSQKWATYTTAVSGSVVTFTLTGTNMYFGGRLIAKGTYNSGGTNDKITLTSVAQERLGSKNGKFYPFGRERPSAITNDKEKFTGYFRDSTTELDYADQRYHNPGQSRFLTPDSFVGSGRVIDPGSWNRYAYTRGDPVNRVDPSGAFDISTYGFSSIFVAPDWAGPGLIAGSDPIGGLDIPYPPGGCMAMGFVEGANGCQNPDEVYGCSARGLVVASANFNFGCEGPFTTVAYQRRPMPAYLKVVDGSDCYIAGSIESNSAERDISYQLYDDMGNMLTGSIVTEHLTGDYLPITGVSSSGEAGGRYNDQHSVLLGHETQQLNQSFTVSSYNYYPTFVDVTVFFRGFGRDFQTLGIYKTQTAVYINGDSGLDQDGHPKAICGR